MNNLEKFEKINEENLLVISGGGLASIPVDMLKFIYDVSYKTGETIGYWIYK